MILIVVGLMALLLSVLIGVLHVIQAIQGKQSTTSKTKNHDNILKICGESNTGKSMDDKDIFIIAYDSIGFY